LGARLEANKKFRVEVTKTVSYIGTELITTVKFFIALALGVKAGRGEVINCCFWKR
jgi:hypothetical protein